MKKIILCCVLLTLCFVNARQSEFQIFTNLYNHNLWTIGESNNISSVCSKDINNYLSDLSDSKLYALKVSEASGRYRGNFIMQNTYWLGSKISCEDVDKFIFPGFSFFVANIFVKLETTNNETKVLQLGQCLPKSCSIQDVENLLEEDPNAKALNLLNGTLEIVKVRNVPGQYKLMKDFKFLFFVSIIACMIVLVIIASIYEASYQQSGRSEIDSVENLKIERNLNIFAKLLLCFAFKSNLKSILKVDGLKGELTIFHGLRFFSMMWTILVHTLIIFFNVSENQGLLRLNEGNFFTQFIGNAHFSVDTFFFMGAFLLVNLFLGFEKNSENPRNLDTWSYLFGQTRKLFYMIFYRVIRLTPAYMGVLFFMRFLMAFLYNESVFTLGFTEDEIDVKCAESWWMNLLYINNIVSLDRICMVWSWYLAVDMQLFIIGGIFLVVSKRYFKFSTISLFLILIASWSTSIYLTYSKNYTYKVFESLKAFDFLHATPWQHYGPFFMGMIGGYILHHNEKPPKISPHLKKLMWILTSSTVFLLVFGVWNGTLNLLLTSLYVSVGHTAWGLTLLWLTLSCCWYPGPVKKFLSYKIFSPLGRLTYCTYLVSPLVMIVTTLQFQAAIDLQTGLFAAIVLGVGVISYILGFFVSVLFEAPFIKMLKLLKR